MGEYDLRNYSSRAFLREFKTDPSHNVRSLRERLTHMDLGQAGGMMVNESQRGFFSLGRIRNLAELPGEENRETEVKVAIGMQLLGMDEEDLLEMRKQFDTTKQVKTEEEITDSEVFELMEKMRAENPKRFDEAARIVREYVEKEKQFAIHIKRN